MAIDCLENCGIAREVPFREVRLAVSMVGGTSLAIYENGVAQELFRVARGRGVYGLLKRITRSHSYVDLLSGTSAGGINTIFLSTALTNRKELWGTHDVWIRLAGIDDLLQMPEDGNVDSVLKGNTYYRKELIDAFNNLIKGEDARKDLGGSGREPFALPSGWLGDGSYTDIDLFVTGTSIEGMPSVFFDARNQPIFNENHNGVFHLKHRPRRKESHFVPALKDPPGPEQATTGIEQEHRSARIPERLAVIARTTSSLPAIFEPAAVDHALMQGIIPLPEREPDARGRQISYFGDGGYLNNRPLNLVLRGIRERPAGPEILRKLVFVEPVAEELRQLSRVQREPTALEHLAFYVGVQGSQSLRDQLDAIHEHNRRVRHVTEALSIVRGAARLDNLPETPEGRQLSKELWVRLRLQQLRDRIIGIWEQQVSERAHPDFGDRQEEVLRRLRTGQRQAQRLRNLRSELLTHLEKHCVELQTDSRPPGSFELGDVDMELRRRMLLRLRDDARDSLYPPEDQASVNVDRAGQPAPEAAKHHRLRQQILQTIARELEFVDVVFAARTTAAAVDRVNRLIQLVELVEELMEQIVRAIGNHPALRNYLEKEVESAASTASTAARDRQEAVAAARNLWGLLGSCIQELLVEPMELDLQNLDTSIAVLRTATNRICDRLLKPSPDDTSKSTAAPASLRTLDAWMDLHFQEAVETLARLLRPALRVWRDLPLGWTLDQDNRIRPWEELRDRLFFLDQRFYPIELAAELPCLSAVEVVHISARDVQVELSSQRPENKLAGDVLMNLGGFLKRSWRVNDLLWGRLDAAGALLDTLLEPGRFVRVASDCDLEELLAAVEGYLRTGNPCLAKQDLATAVHDSVWSRLTNWPDGDEKVEDALKAIRGLLTQAGGPAPAETENAAALIGRWILRRHQLEILVEEVPLAAGAALLEHAEWVGMNTVDAAEAAFLEPDPTKREEIKRRLKDLKKLKTGTATGPAEDAIAQITNEWTSRRFGGDGQGKPDAETVHRYFVERYRVGEETVTGNIPALVNLRRALAGLVISLNVLRNSLKDKQALGAIIKWLLRLIGSINLGLGALYRFIDLTQRGRTEAAVGYAVLWTLIVAGGLAVLFAKLPPGHRWPLLFVTLGILAFVALMWRLRQWRMQHLADRERREAR